ncbi:MAG TPA: DegQ family serine endoprotease [Bryobacteraceae bacterium]|nr:DegQ family serine endoprotease [Bryobacteraceae bacterium]
MKGHIRTSTVVLIAVIAMLVGALGVTIHSRNVPMFIDTAHAASVESGPLVSFAPMVKKAMPAVVNISSSKVVKEQGGSGNGMFDDPFFRQFFGGRMPQQQQPRSQRETSLGSGVVVSPDGYILTNNHVVEGATDVKVSFANKEEYPAKVVGADKYSDVAVLKIDKRGLTTLPFADSAHAEVGDVVLAIGEPFGLGQTVTMGIISAKGRGGLGIERFEDFIQTDAAINRGNSGGALIDTKGELVGINTAILSGETGGNQGIGFAIPANMARNIMDQILKKGKVSRGYMGILPQELTPDMAKAFGMTGHGVAVAEVTANSPALKAGMKVGDVITAINGSPVEDVNSFRLAVAGFAPGTTVHLKVARNGQNLDIPVTLGEYNLDAEGNGKGQDNNLPGTGEKGALRGVSVQGLNSDLRQQLQLPEGTNGVVITDVDSDSPAAAAGLEQGDVIVQVNHKPANTVADFNSAVRAGASKDSTLLLVKRGAGTRFVVVPNK